MTNENKQKSPFQFSFDSEGSPTSVHVDSNWRTLIDPDDFAATLQLSYVEQSARRQAITTSEGYLSPTFRYPSGFVDQVMNLTKDLSTLIESLGTYQPPKLENETFCDQHGRVVISAAGNIPTSVEVHKRWLDSADLNEVEAAIVEAFRALSQAAHPDPTRDLLTSLQSRHSSLVAAQTDFAKGTR